MKIGVCVKQVPDTEARLRVNREGTWLDEQDLPFVLAESDECALEQALQMVEKTGGEVVVFTLGPDRAIDGLRKALALGAHRAIHLADADFAGGDPISNGRALAAALAAEDLDLVLTGSQSDDLGYGATATVIAEILGWPHAWLVMGIELVMTTGNGAGSARVIRELEQGRNEILDLDLPAVLEVQAGINHPRYASLRGIMMAKKKPIERRSCADLGLSVDQVGASSASIELLSVAFPEARGAVELFEGDPETAAKALVARLDREATVLG